MIVGNGRHKTEGIELNVQLALRSKKQWQHPNKRMMMMVVKKSRINGSFEEKKIRQYCNKRKKVVIESSQRLGAEESQTASIVRVEKRNRYSDMGVRVFAVF